MVRSTVLDSSLVNSYVAVDHFMNAELTRDTSTVLLSPLCRHNTLGFKW